MSILVCVATYAELRACKVNDRNVHFLKTGMGLENAENSLQAHLNALVPQKKPSLIISTGFAGAVSKDLVVGDWVTCNQVQGKYPAICFEKAKECELYSLKEVFSAKNKNSVLNDVSASTKPVVVDMESSALAKVAQENGIPFMVLRVISDTPEKPLPDFVGTFVNGALEKKASQKMLRYASGLTQALTHLNEVKKLIREGSKNSVALHQMWKNSLPFLTQLFDSIS